MNVKELRETRLQAKLKSSPINPLLMLKLMVSEVNTVLEKACRKRDLERNDSYLMNNALSH